MVLRKSLIYDLTSIFLLFFLFSYLGYTGKINILEIILPHKKLSQFAPISPPHDAIGWVAKK